MVYKNDQPVHASVVLTTPKGPGESGCGIVSNDQNVNVASEQFATSTPNFLKDLNRAFCGTRAFITDLIQGYWQIMLSLEAQPLLANVIMGGSLPPCVCRKVS